MAKGYSLVGKIKGRLGGAVYRVQDGVQVISERAVTHFNPKSAAQVRHRAIFGLASLISKQLPYVCIAGWAPKPNIARANFVGSLMKFVVVDDTDADNPKATIDAVDIILSNGRAIPLQSSRMEVSLVNASLECEVSMAPNQGVVGGVFVVLYFDKVTHECLGSVNETAAVVPGASNITASLKLGDPAYYQSRDYYGYFIPIIDKTAYISTVYDGNIEVLNDATFAAKVAIELSKREMFCRSVCLGLANVTPD